MIGGFMKKKRNIIIISVIAVLIVIVVLFLVLRQNKTEKSINANNGTAVDKVETKKDRNSRKKSAEEKCPDGVKDAKMKIFVTKHRFFL